MEQHEFRVSFSLGTKLLLSAVSLLLIAIIFLNISTIILVTEDKRAYTYQVQSIQADLIAKEFVNVAKNSLDTLRVSLGSINPTEPLSPQKAAALKAILDNQSQVLGVDFQFLNLDSGELSPIANVLRTQLGRDVRAQDLAIKPDAIKPILAELKSRSFAFMNLSTLGMPPLLGVALADTSVVGNPRGVPVAFGFVPLKGLGKELKSSSLTIANRDGRVFFDTDAEVLFTVKTVTDAPLFTAALRSKLSSGTQEYDNRGERYLGSFLNPGYGVVVMSRTPWRKAMAATYDLTEKYILLGLMVIGAAIIFAVIFSRTLTAPLKRLYEATKEVAAGNFNLELKAGSRDEIGALTGSFNVMSKKIQELIIESMEKVRLENELSIASTVQQTLFPPDEFKSQNVHIRGFYQSASECGGDWWGYFGSQDKLSILIADATGHGIPSALITAAARSCFSVINKWAQDDPGFSYSPSAMLDYANRVVYEAASGKIMMTFFCCTLDFSERKITYSSAGHNPPWLFKKDGSTYTLKSLTAVGQRLGESIDAPPFEEKVADLGVDDILFLYTDGLTEGKNSEDQMYGKKRARKLIESVLANGPDAIIDSLWSDFGQHNGNKPLDDDVTLAAVKVFPSEMRGNA